MQIYKARGKRRIYFFGIGDEVPVMKMSKTEVARRYFPLAASDASARMSLLYLLTHARLETGHLTDRDDRLCREDGRIYLMDVLKDLGYTETMKFFCADHVAAILHFLGDFPDEEDITAK